MLEGRLMRDSFRVNLSMKLFVLPLSSFCWLDGAQSALDEPFRGAKKAQVGP